MPKLEDLGWNAFFASQCTAEDLRDFVAARVTEEHKKFYRLGSANGMLLGELSGAFRHHAQDRQELPAVGDWVLARPRTGERRATIHRVLSRKSKFCRQAAGRPTEEQIVAANVDSVFLMAALDRDFNLRRIERYVALAWESGARPVVLLNKADLSDDPLPRLREAERAAPGVAVLLLSAATGQGIEDLAAYLAHGQTVALLGSSGVGKSTLINRLVGRERQPVAEISAARQRGRHTTTSRQLVFLPAGAILIDTPGMRELQLWDAADGMGRTFDEISQLAANCRFRDCSHRSEPGCAVLGAVEEGSLDATRLESFRKLKRELAFQQRKQDAAARSAEQRRIKQIHKAQREQYKQR